VTDGESIEFNITVGATTEDGRGNITAFAGVRDNEKVLQRDRDYSACSLDTNPATSFACGGSATSYPGYFYHQIPNPNDDPLNPDDDFIPEALTIDTETGNTFRPFDENKDLYNYGPANYYQ